MRNPTGVSFCTVLFFAATTLVVPAATVSAQPRTVQVSLLSDAMRAQVEAGNAHVVGGPRVNDEILRTVRPGVRPGSATVQVAAGSFLVARTDSVSRPASDALRDALRLQVLAEHGPAATELEAVSEIPIDFVEPVGGSGEIRTWRPYVVHPARLRYVDRDGGRAEGSVLVGLRSVTTPGALQGRIGLSIVTDASVEPGAVSFTAEDAEPKRIVVESSLNALSVVLHVHANGAPEDDVRVNLRLPSVLNFENPPRNLQAFGLERRRLVLTVTGAPLTSPVTVSLSAGNATVEPRNVLLHPGSTAEAYVTADATGPLEITATATGLASATAPLTADPPVRYGIAILLGALLGGVFAGLARREQQPLAWQALVLSTLGGVIAAALWIGLSVNITGIPVGKVVFSTIAVFAFAALGGASGSTIAARIVGSAPADRGSSARTGA